ncbi:MAG TPA: hypothetical protein VKZ81_21950 [Pseudonocardia sp.]|uniref:hypothetical protein n=1 Tax=Pseudonocardia sp. TaxID=60912 RepID=UPI002B4AECB0|nr:hypothetical protein [Pseudonocardia sp.]HLU58132.1 hypothetical protein [Pseudonocardia sp.]
MRPPRPAARHRGAAPVAQGLGDPGIDAADTDLADAGRAGERVGRRLAEAVRDMRRLRPPEYQERWGRSPTAHATALGRLVGSLEEEVDVVRRDAGDGGAERELTAFGLAAAWTAAEGLDATSGEQRLRALLPTGIRDDPSLAGVAEEVAVLFEERRYAEAAERLLGRYDELDPEDVVAEIGRELSERIPAGDDGDHLSAFLLGLDASRDAGG